MIPTFCFICKTHLLFPLENYSAKGQFFDEISRSRSPRTDSGGFFHRCSSLRQRTFPPPCQPTHDCRKKTSSAAAAAAAAASEFAAMLLRTRCVYRTLGRSLSAANQVGTAFLFRADVSWLRAGEALFPPKGGRGDAEEVKSRRRMWCSFACAVVTDPASR